MASTRVRNSSYYTIWRDPEPPKQLVKKWGDDDEYISKIPTNYGRPSNGLSASDPRLDLCHVGYTFYLSDEAKNIIRMFIFDCVSKNRACAWTGNPSADVVVSDEQVEQCVDYMMGKTNPRIFVAVIHKNSLKGCTQHT